MGFQEIARWVLQNEYFEAVAIFLGFFFIASLMDFLMKRYGKKLAENTEGEVVGNVMKILHKPTYSVILATGLYLSVKTFTLGPQVIKWVDRGFFIIIAFLISMMIARTSSVLVSSYLKVSRRYEKTPELINKIIAVIIYIIGGLIVLDHFEIEISPVIATLGLGGLAVGLALQDTLKDFFAGLHIISDRPIRVGDFIELEGSTELKGYVVDIGWRSTRIRTLPNNYVIVPNSKLAASTIVNDSMPQKELALYVDVGVDYGSNLEEVERVTCEVAKYVQENVPGAVEKWDPFIRFHTFGDNNINFRTVLRIKEYTDRFLVRNEFFKKLHERYKEEGIEISWPIRKVYDMERNTRQEKVGGKTKK